MAKKHEILDRRNDLKIFMVENRNIAIEFRDIRDFYDSNEFSIKHGILSDSAIRADLKALNVYMSEDNYYSIDADYILDELDSNISSSLNYFKIYRPISISSPLDINFDKEFDDSDISNDLNLYSIFLEYSKPPIDRSTSKFTIDFFIKKISDFYSYKFNDSNFYYKYVTKNNNTVQFVFNNFENTCDFYYDLINWKKSLLKRKSK